MLILKEIIKLMSYSLILMMLILIAYVGLFDALQNNRGPLRYFGISSHDREIDQLKAFDEADRSIEEMSRAMTASDFKQKLRDIGFRCRPSENQKTRVSCYYQYQRFFNFTFWFVRFYVDQDGNVVNLQNVRAGGA